MWQRLCVAFLQQTHFQPGFKQEREFFSPKAADAMA
jgi:hypothetical protein